MRKRIVLIHCARLNDIAPIITMGLWGIADYLNHAGYEVTIVNTKSEELSTGAFDVNNVINADTILVGFSVQWFPNLKESLMLADEIKKNYEEVPILFGGFTASFFAEKIIKNYESVDFVICGDGEKPILELLNVMGRKKMYPTVENLVYRDEFGRIVKNPITYITIQNEIDGVEFASFEKYLFRYKENRNVLPFNLKYGEIANFDIIDFKCQDTFFLLTGKGCNVNCNYCGGSHESQLIINNRRKCFYMKDEQIIDTIKQAISHGYKSFYVCYDPLPNNPRYVSWLEKLATLNLEIDLFFGFWSLPPFEVINKFKSVTTNLIFEISPETISEDLRKRVRGFNFSNKNLYSTIDTLVKNKIYTWIYFSYPLAFETYEDVVNTRRAFWKINSEYPHYVEAFYLKQSTDPGAPIYNNPEEYDMVIDSFDLNYHMGQINKKGNILVHHHKDKNKLLDIEYKHIAIDNILKKIFRYTLKYFVRAFPCIEKFLEFIDDFYEKKDICIEMSEAEIAINLRNYVFSESTFKIFEPYLLELISFMAAQVQICISEEKIDFLTFVKSDLEDIQNLHLKVNPAYCICTYNYNLVAVYKTLLINKEYMPVIKLEQPQYYAFSKIQNEFQFSHINETLYLLITGIEANKNKPVSYTLKEIAETYAETQAELDFILHDLKNTVVELIKQHILYKKEEPNL
jgi:hypothetical protein